MLRLVPFLALLGQLAAAGGHAAADIAFYNGTVYTATTACPVAEAIAIKDGLITFVGSGRELKAYTGANTTLIDLEGRMLMPGLIDTHVHSLTGGRQLLQCDLAYAALTHAEFQTNIQACLDLDTTAPASKWLEVVNWDRQAMLTLSGDPTKATLDVLNTVRPIYVRSTDGHSGLVNSVGLALANITSTTVAPAGGAIIKDADGNPTGILEDEAKDLITAAIPADSEEDLLNHGRAALELFRSEGITSFQDAWSDQTHAEVYNALHELGELTSRASFAWRISVEEATTDIPAAIVQAQNISTNDQPIVVAAGVTWRTIKLFMDGILQSPANTASLLEPYLTNVNGTYVQTTNDTVPAYLNGTIMRDLVAAAFDANFDMQVHAIGDNSVRLALDAVQDYIENSSNSASLDYRIGIAHDELVSPDDWARFAELDATAVMMYQWAQLASYWDDDTRGVLGPDRVALLEPSGEIKKRGGKVVFGSDWPIDPLDEFLALKVGVTRSGDPLNPNSYASYDPIYIGKLNNLTALTRDEVLRSITIDAAAFLRMDDVTGSLERGKFADLIVLENDFLASTDDLLGQNRALLTMVGGRVVYTAADSVFAPLDLVQRKRGVERPSLIVSRHASSGHHVRMGSNNPHKREVSGCGHDH